MGEAMTVRVVKMSDGPVPYLVVGDEGLVVSPIQEFLRYLAARSFSTKTIRAYAYDLLSYWRWLCRVGKDFTHVTSEDVLEFIEWQKTVYNPQHPDTNVYRIADGRNSGLSVLTINRRLAAVSGLYEYHLLQNPSAVRRNPVPTRQQNRSWRQVGRRRGLLGHVRRAEQKSSILLRLPRKLPRPLEPKEIEQLVGSLRKCRDKAIALLMLFGGLRSSEVLALRMGDIDLERRSVRVWGKGATERMVPIDADTARAIHHYILYERPEVERAELFLVLKGPKKGRPLTPAGLRTVFRYHRERSGVLLGNPHRLRHTYGTNMAEAGVDIQVLKELMGHASIDSTTQYVHLSATHLRREYDAALQKLKGDSGHE